MVATTIAPPRVLLLSPSAGLANPRRAPKGRSVYIHGPIVHPTPDSCAAWLERAGELDVRSSCDEWSWRKQAVSAGVGGLLSHREDEWLKPLLTAVAAGRSRELGTRAMQMQRRWERNGRIIYQQDATATGEELLTQILHGYRFHIDVASGGEASPKLLTCDETACAVEGLF